MILITFVLLFPTILLPVCLPVFTLPPPTGPYKVGTTWEIIIDQSRPETLTDDQNDYRKLAVKLWYPSDTMQKAKKASYWRYSRFLSKYMAEYYRVPSFFFEYLGLVKTNSMTETEISGNRDSFPVVLSLHGGNCINYVTDLSVLNEELASYGFIVIGLTHPYSSLPVIFSDTERAVCPLERRMAIKQQTQLSKSLWTAYFSQQDTGEEELLQQIFTVETITITEIGRRMEDIQSVLNWLDDSNSEHISSILTGKCNTDKLSILGVHMGGSVAFNIFLREQRIKACINLDGFHYTDAKDLTLTKPYMLITSETSQLHTLKFIQNQLDTQSILLSVKGTTQQSFTDYPLFSPLIDLFQLNGKFHYKQVVDMTRDSVTLFLKTHILEEESFDVSRLLKKYGKMIIPFTD